MHKGYKFSFGGYVHEFEGELPRSPIVAHVNEVREPAFYMYLTASKYQNVQHYALCVT